VSSRCRVERNRHRRKLQRMDLASPGLAECRSPGASWPHIGPYIHRIFSDDQPCNTLQQEHLPEPWI
jgi:hypothetical protein